jgi:hypothetical protein
MPRCSTNRSGTPATIHARYERQVRCPHSWRGPRSTTPRHHARPCRAVGSRAAAHRRSGAAAGARAPPAGGRTMRMRVMPCSEQTTSTLVLEIVATGCRDGCHALLSITPAALIPRRGRRPPRIAGACSGQYETTPPMTAPDRAAIRLTSRRSAVILSFQCRHGQRRHRGANGHATR